MRNDLLHKMRQHGVNMGGSGENTVRLRPMLVFGPEERVILMDRLREVCKEMSTVGGGSM